MVVLLNKIHFTSCTSSCGRQEGPAILISRLLLRMRRMYADSIPLTTNGMHIMKLITRVWTICHL